MATLKNTRQPTGHIAPFGLRLQPELKERLEAEAEKSGRSLNAELAARLEDSLSVSHALDTMSLLSRLQYLLAEGELETALLKGRIGELAHAIRIAVYYIPQSAYEENPELRGEVDDWFRSVAEGLQLAADFDVLAVEKLEQLKAAKEKVQKYDIHRLRLQPSASGINTPVNPGALEHAEASSKLTIKKRAPRKPKV